MSLAPAKSDGLLDSGAMAARSSDEITEEFLKSAAGMLYTAMREDMNAAIAKAQVAVLRAASAEANSKVWLHEIAHLQKELAKAKKQSGKTEPEPVYLDDRIKAAIKKHPNAGDREIARLVECAPATVSKLRAKTGKPLAERTVIKEWQGLQDARQDGAASPTSG
jgi:hypothetical protein